MPVTASVITAFVIAQLISYLLEKRFVFRKAILSSNLKQILLFVFRAAVNFGFFKLSDTLFGGILKMQDSFVWLVSISMSFFFNYFFDRTLLFDCAYDAGSVRKSKIYKAFFTNRFVLFSGLLAAVCIAIIYTIQNRDYPVIMGTTIFLATLIILMNVVVDLLYKLADPRINLTKGD